MCPMVAVEAVRRRVMDSILRRTGSTAELWSHVSTAISCREGIGCTNRRANQEVEGNSVHLPDSGAKDKETWNEIRNLKEAARPQESGSSPSKMRQPSILLRESLATWPRPFPLPAHPTGLRKR
jgi:hypothetical protein